MFVDKAKVHVKAGDGGNGCVASRLEQFVTPPAGAPLKTNFLPVVLPKSNGGRAEDDILEREAALEAQSSRL